MFKWAQKQLANVAGTQEPIYGPEAIRSVAEEAKTTPITEIDRDGLKWKTPDATCVETEVFYLMSDSGHLGVAQVIYSNVAGIKTTCQFISKIFYLDGSKPTQWCSTQLHNHDFNEDRTAFYADDCALELSEDGQSYTIKSINDDNAIVNLTVTRKTPGFHAGKTGSTLYGEDLSNPWGSMRHAFWPRCSAEGKITTKDGPINFKGRAMFVYALQGMKPHHLAARWNFVDFQGPKYSAVMMEYTTPPSYGSTVVNVGAIVTDGEIVFGGCDNTATHLKSRRDTKTGWPEPTHVKFTWSGKTKDGKPAEALLECELEERADKIDVMAEVPVFVKKIAAGAAGTKPYIYQFMSRKNKPILKLKLGDEEISEEGDLFNEATFISGDA